MLKAIRGIGFEEIMDPINNGDLLADIAHPSSRRSYQPQYVIKVGRYAYTIPYVCNRQKHEIFLKTAYPSRALTKKYINGDNHGQ